MTTLIEMKDHYALVTGGSSGIGAAIVDELAAHGANLVLVGRDHGRLARVAADLRARHGVAVLEIRLDLAAADAPARLVKIVDDAGIEVELLVNSAGMSSRAMVEDSDPATLRHLVDLNVGALTELTTALVARMVRRGHGSIINVASTGAYTPAPEVAGYAASKAYVLSFSHALWAEVKDRGVRVVTVVPGPTETAMNPHPGRGKRRPAQVARTALAALEKGRPVVIDGGRNKLMAHFLRTVPTRVMTNLALIAACRRRRGELPARARSS